MLKWRFLIFLLLFFSSCPCETIMTLFTFETSDTQLAWMCGTGLAEWGVWVDSDYLWLCAGKYTPPGWGLSFNSRGHSKVKLQKGPQKEGIERKRGKNSLTVADSQEDGGCPFIIGHRAFIVVLRRAVPIERDIWSWWGLPVLFKTF